MTDDIQHEKAIREKEWLYITIRHKQRTTLVLSKWLLDLLELEILLNLSADIVKAANPILQLLLQNFQYYKSISLHFPCQKNSIVTNIVYFTNSLLPIRLTQGGSQAARRRKIVSPFLVVQMRTESRGWSHFPLVVHKSYSAGMIRWWLSWACSTLETGKHGWIEKSFLSSCMHSMDSYQGRMVAVLSYQTTAAHMEISTHFYYYRIYIFYSYQLIQHWCYSLSTLTSLWQWNNGGGLIWNPRATVEKRRVTG